MQAILAILMLVGRLGTTNKGICRALSLASVIDTVQFGTLALVCIPKIEVYWARDQITLDFLKSISP